jgi:sugar phosphate isomerase/epimerase
MHEFMCSSHTISGLMPGSPRASRHGLEERLAACAGAGYAGYWLHHRDYLEQRAAGLDDEQLRDLFDRCGMRHRGVEFLTGWFLPGDVAAKEAERAAFDAAKAIGARVANVGADFSGHGLERRAMVAHFSALCARAADLGLSIALEIVPWSNVPDVEAALDFMEPANAGLVIDCWHIFRGGVPLSELGRIPPERILCVQVNDAEATPVGQLAEDTLRRKQCGEGAFDLVGFAAALDRMGVMVPFSVEIISPEVAALPVEEAARVSFAAARRVFGGNESSSLGRKDAAFQ